MARIQCELTEQEEHICEWKVDDALFEAVEAIIERIPEEDFHDTDYCRVDQQVRRRMIKFLRRPNKSPFNKNKNVAAGNNRKVFAATE